MKHICMALALSIAAAAPHSASALGPTTIGVDAFSYGIDFGFAFGQLTATPNANDSITIDAIAAPGGNSFGALGLNFNTISGASGLNFDVTNYDLEMVYKVLPNNQATFVNVQLQQQDGGGTNETYNWGLGDIVTTFNTGTPDADGFVTITRDLGELPNPFTGSLTDPFDFTFGSGDGLPDFDAFENGEANILSQLQLQSVDGSNRLNIELKALRLKEKSPVVARLDGGGWNRSYDAFDDPGVLTRDNGVDALTNLVIDTDQFGGVLQRGLPSVDVFDGNTHSIQVTARLLPGNEAGAFGVIIGDLDGNDDAPGAGADGAFYPVLTESFSETGFATVSIPISSQTPGIGPAFGFFNTGDGSFDELNLYELQVQSISDGARLHIELESVEIVPTPALTGDYNGDGVVDAADYTTFRFNEGGDAATAFAFGSRDPAATGPIGPADYTAWANNLGASAGGAPTTAVPEPGSLAMVALGVGVAAFRRGRAVKPSRF